MEEAWLTWQAESSRPNRQEQHLQWLIRTEKRFWLSLYLQSTSLLACMGQNLLVPSDSTVDLGQHHFLYKNKSNQTFTVDIYLGLSRIIFRFISNHPDGYPMVQDFLGYFSSFILYYPWYVLFYLFISQSSDRPRFCPQTMSYFILIISSYWELSRARICYIGM